MMNHRLDGGAIDAYWQTFKLVKEVVESDALFFLQEEFSVLLCPHQFSSCAVMS